MKLPAITPWQPLPMVCHALLGLFLATAGLAQTHSGFDHETPPGAHFATAQFRLWLPEAAQSLRAVLVLVPGSNADGRGLIQDATWQNFARQHRLALVGCCFKDHPHADMNIEAYAQAGQGSGAALLDAVSHFAQISGHGELAAAPLLLWGTSAGGEFNYEFACWKPERVMAFVVNKGGYYYTHLAPRATRAVPGIFFTGGKDEEFRTLSIRGIFAMNQRAGAVWQWAHLPQEGHEEGETRRLAIEFFEAQLKSTEPK